MKIAILANANQNVPPWDPESIETGIGGSEEAIIYVAQELVKQLHIVKVFAQPPQTSKWSEETQNPCYLNVDEFLNRREKYDIAICWRRQDFATAYGRSKKVFAWHHDLPIQMMSIEQQQFHDRFLTASFYLSQFQKEKFEQMFPSRKLIPNVIAGNGIVLPNENKKPIIRIGGKCVYISNWARGLEGLLQLWPSIHQNVPEATLDIYYGPQTWGLWDANKTNQILQQIQKMKEIGVRNMGMVGHKQLNQALSEASILAYPCNCYAETYCISVVKAQALGVIPVTSRMGALQETVEMSAPTVPTLLTHQDWIDYGNLLITTLHKTLTTDTYNWRNRFIDFAREKTWTACISKWMMTI